jgi:hypothetical protein
MTQAPLTVTDHLRAALTALEQADGDNTPAQFLVARAEIERALSAIQRMRCDAQAALDKL